MMLTTIESSAKGMDGTYEYPMQEVEDWMYDRGDTIGYPDVEYGARVFSSPDLAGLKSMVEVRKGALCQASEL